jgi:hypothetical protein
MENLTTLTNLVNEIQHQKSMWDEEIWNDNKEELLKLGSSLKNNYEYEVKFISSPQDYNEPDYISHTFKFELDNWEELEYFFDDYVYNDMRWNWKDYDLKDKQDIYQTEIEITIVKK